MGLRDARNKLLVSLVAIATGSRCTVCSFEKVHYRSERCWIKPGMIVKKMKESCQDYNCRNTMRF